MATEEKSSKDVWTNWEFIALTQADREPVYASSGSGAIFDAAWELHRRGLLTRMWDEISTQFLVMNSFGQAALQRERAVRNDDIGTLRETFLSLMDRAGIPRDQYEETKLIDVERAIEEKKSKDRTGSAT